MQSQDHMKLIPRTICHGEVGGPPMLEAEASGDPSGQDRARSRYDAGYSFEGAL